MFLQVTELHYWHWHSASSWSDVKIYWTSVGRQVNGMTVSSQCNKKYVEVTTFRQKYNMVLLFRVTTVEEISSSAVVGMHGTGRRLDVCLDAARHFSWKEIKKIDQNKHSAIGQIHMFQVRMDNRSLTVWNWLNTLLDTINEPSKSLQLFH